jgi:hypothetical protein
MGLQTLKLGIPPRGYDNLLISFPIGPQIIYVEFLLESAYEIHFRPAVQTNSNQLCPSRT